MSNQSPYLISKLGSTTSTKVPTHSSTVDEHCPSTRFHLHRCNDSVISSLGSNDDSYLSNRGGGRSSRESGPKIFVDNHDSTTLKESPQGPRVHVTTNNRQPTCHVNHSPSSSNRHVLPLAVATPVTPCTPDSCCKGCKRKNLKLRKQAEEIEQLKCLVSRLVGLLGTSMSQDTAGTVNATKEDVRNIHPESSTSGLVVEVPSEPQAAQPYTSCDESEAPRQRDDGGDEPSIPPSTDIRAPPSSNNIGLDLSSHSLDERSATGNNSASGAMLRLCRLKQQKIDSEPSSPKSPAGKRHIHVCVRGAWGYYSGPTLEQNKKLQGCVVRFDNGDLYLGDMILHVPTTTTFTDEHGLQFHGRGTLYRKGGPTIRGLFHRHELKD
jgi:hypothetical protein